MEWFKNWFNTPYYHILYKNRDEKEAEKFIKNLINKFKFRKEAYFLDLACGKGRHAYMLNKHGYKVLGLDLSEQSIEEAKKLENISLKFAVNDMRESYAESNTFDAVFNLFTSIGYFENPEDNLKVFKSVVKQLKPSGYFILDFLNSKKAIKSLKTKELKTLGGINFNISKNLEKGKIIKTIEFLEGEKEYKFYEKLEALSLSDFKSLINLSGLELISLFGDYDLNSFNEDNSDRLILIMRKA